MKIPVTPPHVPVIAIPSLVMIYQLWLKKMPVELYTLAQKDNFILKMSICQVQFTPEDEIIPRKQFHSHKFSSFCQVTNRFYRNCF